MQYMIYILSLCLLHDVVSIVTAANYTCERSPLYAKSNDSQYILGVAGDPDLFVPGELYTISLQGVDSGQGPTPFSGFLIWAEMEEEPLETLNNEDSSDNITKVINTSNDMLGSFQAYDAQTKPTNICKPAVSNATAHSKTEIQVIWSAPIKLLGACIRLCARVNPTLDAKKWSVLAHKLCVSPTSSNHIVRQPPIVDPCCACDEAKYEVTFDGMWSRNTHPRDFPPDSARAHFGDVIGASHRAQFRVWLEGKVASVGLRKLAEDGSTTALEKELKAESDHIRTIIKARGISWQQVASGGIPSTFAVFRVDPKNHLVSLAAKLAPSPDWIVGVSALELCNANCTWSQSLTLPLFPYDAGTDDGITYTARGQPTSPAAPVRALRADWPKDVRSPFFNSNGEMRPFARLRLNRRRLYEKTCDGNDPIGESRSSEQVGSCAISPWSAWGPCSVSCGEGRAARQRHYVWSARANSEACRLPLTEHRRCYGPRYHCRTISEYEADPAESTGPCAVSPWSKWSACEGCGVRARSRHYLVPRAHKRCNVGYRARTEMSQARPCQAGPCVRPSGLPPNSSNFDWFFVDIRRDGECLTSPWSDWSPCTARCGRGRRIRTRLYIASAKYPHIQPYLTRRLIHTWNTWFLKIQNLGLVSIETIDEMNTNVI